MVLLWLLGNFVGISSSLRSWVLLGSVSLKALLKKA